MSNPKPEIISSDPKKAAAQKKAKAKAEDVFQPPTITREPASRQARLGSRVVLRITATGKPLPNYQWFHNNRKISGANSDRLTIPKARRSAAGSYHCEAKNFAGHAASRDCMLSFFAKPVPKIVIGPAVIHAAEGQKLELSVISPTAAELRDFKVYWVFNGMRIKGAIGALLRISTMKKKYEGEYKAMIAAGGVLEMSNVAQVVLGAVSASLAPPASAPPKPRASGAADIFFNPEDSDEAILEMDELVAPAWSSEDFGQTATHAPPLSQLPTHELIHEIEARDAAGSMTILQLTPEHEDPSDLIEAWTRGSIPSPLDMGEDPSALVESLLLQAAPARSVPPLPVIAPKPPANLSPPPPAPTAPAASAAAFMPSLPPPPRPAPAPPASLPAIETPSPSPILRQRKSRLEKMLGHWQSLRAKAPPRAA